METRLLMFFLSKMWGRWLKLDYPVQVSLKKVVGKTVNDRSYDALTAGVYETIKYCVKIPDLLSKQSGERGVSAEEPFDDNDFTPQYINQMYGVRTISVGGILKRFLGGDVEDLINGGQTEDEVTEAAEEFETYVWDESEVSSAWEFDLGNGETLPIGACHRNDYVNRR